MTIARSHRGGSLIAVLAALALLATPLPVLAVFAVNIMGPGAYIGGITVSDNSAGDANPVLSEIQVTPGTLATLPSIPGFLFSIDTALTNSPGGPGFSLVNLASTLDSFGASGVTILTASTTDSTVLTSSVGGRLSGAGGGFVAAQQYVDLAKGLFALGAVVPGSHGAFSTASFNGTASTGFVAVPQYSTTDQLALPLGPDGLTAGNLQSIVVPEPITVFLGGTGLLVLGYAGWRRLFGR